MRPVTLARQLLLLQLGIVLIAVAVTAAFAIGGARARAVEQQRARVVATATTLAESSEVQAALITGRPTNRLAPLAERTRVANGFAFVVFMSPDGLRYSHPTPSEIGRPYVGVFRPARDGTTFTETRLGTLGRSVRAVQVVRSPTTGRIVGYVAVGVLQTTIAAQARGQLPALGAAALIALLVGAIGSLLLSRRVQRQTRGMDPVQLATLYDHHEAVLQAIREGVVVVDPDGVVRLLNDEARRLLGIDAAAVGRAVDDVVADRSLRAVLRGETEEASGLHVVGGRVLVSGRRASPGDDGAIGTVTTLRDRTELEGLVRELATVSSLADALRAQAHEAANELHTVVGLVELGRHEDAIAFATRRMGVTQDEVDVVQHHVGDPALAALLLAKAATCRERGVHLQLDPASDLPAGVMTPEDLVTIVGNLIDNALDALADRGSGRIDVLLLSTAGDATIRVSDDGPGFPPEALESAFEPGWSTKTETGAGQRGLGLALVEATVRRTGGTASAHNQDGAVILVVVPVVQRSEVPA
ncbi:MAG: ATP-binding protein [Solirubrobacteraceae bacterium]|nr:ATP-binding protein [Solirubrobacteraceae bacterium]